MNTASTWRKFLGAIALGGIFVVSFLVLKDRQARACREQVVASDLAAMEFQLATGKELPQDLKQLVPKYLPSVPSCPVSGVVYRVAPHDKGMIVCPGQADHDLWQVRSLLKRAKVAILG